MKKNQKGFTLVELMVVVAIIGILAAVSIPAYQDYIKGALISNAIAEANSYKIKVVECASQTQSIADCDTGASSSPYGLPSENELASNTKYIKAILNSQIYITNFGNKLSANFSLIPHKGSNEPNFREKFGNPR